MRVVVQRTTKAKCLVDNQITGQIEKGFLLLVGFTQEDGVQEVEFMARKILGLRIFEDETVNSTAIFRMWAVLFYAFRSLRFMPTAKRESAFVYKGFGL